MNLRRRALLHRVALKDTPSSSGTISKSAVLETRSLVLLRLRRRQQRDSLDSPSSHHLTPPNPAWPADTIHERELSLPPAPPRSSGRQRRIEDDADAVPVLV